MPNLTKTSIPRAVFLASILHLVLARNGSVAMARLPSRPNVVVIVAEDRRLFAAATTHMDDAIGRIVEAVERIGERENTLVIFFSDNGALTDHVGGKYPPPDPLLASFTARPKTPWQLGISRPLETSNLVLG